MCFFFDSVFVFIFFFFVSRKLTANQRQVTFIFIQLFWDEFLSFIPFLFRFFLYTHLTLLNNEFFLLSILLDIDKQWECIDKIWNLRINFKNIFYYLCAVFYWWRNFYFRFFFYRYNCEILLKIKRRNFYVRNSMWLNLFFFFLSETVIRN